MTKNRSNFLCCICFLPLLSSSTPKILTLFACPALRVTYVIELDSRVEQMEKIPFFINLIFLGLWIFLISPLGFQSVLLTSYLLLKKALQFYEQLWVDQNNLQWDTSSKTSRCDFLCTLHTILGTLLVIKRKSCSYSLIPVWLLLRCLK